MRLADTLKQPNLDFRKTNISGQISVQSNYTTVTSKTEANLGFNKTESKPESEQIRNLKIN